MTRMAHDGASCARVRRHVSTSAAVVVDASAPALAVSTRIHTAHARNGVHKGKRRVCGEMIIRQGMMLTVMMLI